MKPSKNIQFGTEMTDNAKSVLYIRGIYRGISLTVIIFAKVKLKRKRSN